MSREPRLTKLRAVAMASLKEGDDEMALALTSLVASLSGVSTMVPAMRAPMTAAERAASYRARQRHESRDGERDETSRNSVTKRHVTRDVTVRDVEGGKGGGLSLGITGISSDSSGSDPKENTQNPLSPPRRKRAKAAECDAPSVTVVVDEQMQNMARERNWPNPFEAYECLKDNYLRRGIRGCGIEGWKGALRQWLRKNLDGQPPWNVTLQRETDAETLRIHRERDAKRTDELSAAGILPGFGASAPANETADYMTTLQSVAQAKRGAA